MIFTCELGDICQRIGIIVDSVVIQTVVLTAASAKEPPNEREYVVDGGEDEFKRKGDYKIAPLQKALRSDRVVIAQCSKMNLKTS